MFPFTIGTIGLSDKKERIRYKKELDIEKSARISVLLEPLDE